MTGTRLYATDRTGGTVPVLFGVTTIDRDDPVRLPTPDVYNVEMRLGAQGVNVFILVDAVSPTRMQDRPGCTAPGSKHTRFGCCATMVLAAWGTSKVQLR